VQNIFLFGSKRKFFETSTYYPQIFPPAGLAGYGGERKKKEGKKEKEGERRFELKYVFMKNVFQQGASNFGISLV